jgi:hypothetical protein
MKAGRPTRFDYEYERNGTANRFMMVAPLEGWRHVKVTDHRPGLCSRLEGFGRYPLRKCQENRSGPGQSQPPQQGFTVRSLCCRRSQAVGRALANGITPKHGSCLDLAESELGVLSSQCLDRRIPDKQTLIDEIAAWERDRNVHHTKSHWHFTTKDARIKLKHLYPSI